MPPTMPTLRSVLPLLLLSACTPSETTTTAPSSAASSAPAPAETTANVFHYDLVLTITEGTTTQKTSMTLDLSDRAHGTVRVGKNVPLVPAVADGGAAARPAMAVSRSDVGTNIKAKLSMEGNDPRLEIDAAVSSVDPTGKVRRSQSNAAVVTPVGKSVVLFEKTEEKVQYKLTATATKGSRADATLGARAPSGSAASHVVDVVATQSGAGAAPKTTNLSLTLDGETPATAHTGENVPLAVTDGGIGTPRQDTGVRVKATAHPRTTGLELDVDVEWSAVEPAGNGLMTLRKVTSHGPVLATFDKPTTILVAEDDGRRYEVTLTPHRPK